MSLNTNPAGFALLLHLGAPMVNYSYFMPPFPIWIALGMTYPRAPGNAKSQTKTNLPGSTPEVDQTNSYQNSSEKKLRMSLDFMVADFALRTYHEANAVNQSFFISPFSILVALGMAYVGSSGNTKSQMKATLFESSLEDGQINLLMRNATRSLSRNNASNGYELHLANRLFAASKLHILPTYKKCIKEQYSGDIELVDFGQSEEARKHINGWVENKTNGKIEDLLPRGAISQLTRLVLVNAIYLKADWRTPFKAEFTRKETFFMSQGKEKQVEMMRMTKYFQYSEEDEYQILGLPYATDELVMYFVLPIEKFGLKDMMTKLNATKLLDSLDSTVETKVEVRIPKFRLRTELQLKEILKRLGLTDIFSPSLADLSRITGKRDLYVSEAFHKAFIEVDEKGTEAAAATALAMLVGSAGPSRFQPPKFIADHPFLFAIIDRSSRVILFIGDYHGDSTA